MSQQDLVCLSLTPNLRCVGFTLGQFKALVIPPVIELTISLFFIYLYSGPGRQYDRWAQILLAVDSILYFIWTLLDMLSHVVPAARTSLHVFESLDFIVGAASFTPILVYSVYLYRLSVRDFIPTLPRKLQRCLEIALPVLLVIAVAINEVSSFVGTHSGSFFIQRSAVVFSHYSESLWLSLSLSSLAVYAIIQFTFFLLAFSRLSKVFLNLSRIELTHSDERHYFHGIAWITAGVIIGVIETIAGFAQASFGVALTRKIFRLSSRAVLMYGLLKGLDAAGNFETLTDELHDVSKISRRISQILGVNRQRMNTPHCVSQPSEQARVGERSPSEKQPRNQRVIVQCEKGQAPFLQIRLSTFESPTRGILADVVQLKRGSAVGSIPGHAGAHQHGENVSFKGAKSTVVSTSSHHALPDWMQPPEWNRTRHGSGATVSDNLSVVRDLERRFPNLPPRVTGKYRGSILGENYEEDLFPVVGISRQSSLRQGNLNEEGGTSAALSSSGSIKRKPAPPLLENIPYISGQRNRPASMWGGLTQSRSNHPVIAPVVPYNPLEGTTVYNPDSAHTGAPSNLGTPNIPRPRKMTARDLIKRASRAMSDASIRSAEWLASASSSRMGRTPLTVRDIEMYRQGNIGPRSPLPRSGVDEVSLPGVNLLPQARRSMDDTSVHSKPSQSYTTTRTSIGEIPMRTSPTPAELESRYWRVSSSHESENLDEVWSG